MKMRKTGELNYANIDRRLRVLDLTLVVILSPIWVTVILATAAASLLTQGRPIFYVSERLGRRANTYKMLKFRTMIVHADQYLDDAGMPTRERVTPIGKRLRRWSLDEVPQILNVLKGDMSLVGPRPMLPTWISKIPLGAAHPRFSVRPGLTGLAQLDGRNTVVWSRRLLRDSEYAKQRGAGLYLSILVRTPAAMLKSTVAPDRNSNAVDDL